jgi:hypothetical protein
MSELELLIANDGAEIVSTNFWDKETSYSKIGAFYLSINAGCFRLLVPDCYKSEVPDMRKGCKYIVVNRGKMDHARFAQDSLHRETKTGGIAPDQGMEILFEDKSDNPYAVHIGNTQVDRLPTGDSAGVEWRFFLYVSQFGKPKRVFERKCYYQVVPKIPHLKGIEG